MDTRTAMAKAFHIVGKIKLAKKLGISYQSMNRWHDYNEMPCTEFNGKTKYSKMIEKATDGKVTVTDLCGFVPPPQA